MSIGLSSQPGPSQPARGGNAPERPTGHAPRRTVPVVQGFSGIGLAAFGIGMFMLWWHGSVLLSGYFYQDDFLYMYRASTQPFGTYLTQNYSGHLMPGQFLLVWLTTYLAPVEWTLAVLVTTVMQVAVFVLQWRLLVRLFGRRWEILIPFAALATSPLVFIGTTWWAYALQLLPLQIAMAGALHAHVGFVQTGNRRSAVAGVLWTIGGLLFWEKALLIVPVVVVVTAALLDGSLSRRFWDTARRYRGLWLWYTAVVACYVAIYLNTADTGGGPRQRIEDVATLARHMVVDTFIPGALGGPWRVRLIAATGFEVPPAAVLAVTGTVAVAIVALGLWSGRRRAVIAWGLLAGYLAVGVAMVSALRLHVIGPIIGQDVRYVADAVQIAALAGALAFLPPIRAGAAEPPPAPSRNGRVALAVGCVFAVGALVTTIGTNTPWSRHEIARDYVTTASDALRERPGTVLYDGPVPKEVMIDWFLDDARVSRVIGPLGLDVAFDRPTGEMLILDDTGTPREMRLTDTVSGTPGPVPDCGHPLRDEHLEIPVDPAWLGKGVVRIGYFSEKSQAGTIAVGDVQEAVRFEAGLHHLYLVVHGLAPVISANLSTDGTVCVTDVLIGKPQPLFV